MADPGVTVWACPDGGRVWRAGAGMSQELDCGTLVKAAGDRRYYRFDFGDLPELAAETLSGPAVSALPSGLTVESVAVNAGGYAVGFWLSGGDAGTDYTLTVAASLSGGGAVARSGLLRVVAPAATPAPAEAARRRFPSARFPAPRFAAGRFA